MSNRTIDIDPLSARSHLIELMAHGRSLSTATGFIVQPAEQPYLITNWHVVTGRHADTGELLSPETGAIPDEVRILHHSRGMLGRSWGLRTETLRNPDGTPRWIEHPKGQKIDVVAVPLQAVDQNIDIYPFDLSLADTDVDAQPAMPVSIIGFPFGLLTVGGFPIWKTGHIASEPELDYGNEPNFLIDATTRKGMSGSPVVLRLYGAYPTRDGPVAIGTKGVTRFLGVYSGRIHGEAEIGRVWRPHVIQDILSSL